MSYGLKYTTQFDSQTDDNNPSVRYTLEFHYKDYSGGVYSVMGADTTVTQRCTVDDPFAPIKGQSLSISLVNFGNIPITAFYADEDDGIKVILKDASNNIKFIGFVVQDDSFEDKVDFVHTITLSATDSLGLLKGVILDQAIVRRGFLSAMTTDGNNSIVYLNVLDTAFYLAIGDTLEIQGITYTVTSFFYGQLIVGGRVYNWTVGVTPATPGISYTIETIYLTGRLDLILRNSLIAYIAACLYNTNLGLLTNIFCNISAYPQSITSSHFEQTLLDGGLWVTGNTYDNCYSVLSRIMETFRCSLFQADGEWNIVHWEEMRFYSNNAIPGFVYNEAFNLSGTTVFNNNFFIGPSPQLTRPIYPLQEGAYRPYKFVRKQFDYHQPKYLFKNYDLQQVGALIRQYVVGVQTVYEYVAIDFSGYVPGFTSAPTEVFIRVVIDNPSGAEEERYLVLRGGTSTNPAFAAECSPIEGNKGDKIKFSFTTRTNISIPPTYFAFYYVRLADGTTTRFVDDLPEGNGAWGSLGFDYIFTQNTNQWTNIEIASGQMPFDGIITCILARNDNTVSSSTRETHYKDIRFEYIPYVTDSTKVTGHVHKNERNINTKNNSSELITIDNSPKNSIIGTLFQPTVTVIQDRCGVWIYNYDITTGYANLGTITTAEELRWRDRLRSKLEGGFIGLYQNNCISLLTIGKTDFAITKNYVPGLMTIDYKRNQFNCTLWEIYDEAEPDLNSDYTFTYLYSAT